MTMTRRLLFVLVGCLSAAAAAAGQSAAPAASGPAAAPTFAKDVAPIMFNKCANCHRPGEVAPMSLLVVRGRAAVGQGDQDQGAWRARCRPGAPTRRTRCRCATTSACRRQEIETHRRVGRWRRAEGQRRRPAAVADVRDGLDRTAREPDYILEMPVEFDIPAEGELGVQMFYSKVPWTEDKFAEIARAAAEQPRRACITPACSSSTFPKARTIVDGRLVDRRRQASIDASAGSRGLPSTDSARCPARASCCRGCRAAALDMHRADVGKRIPAGKYINWQLHYNPTGKPEKDRTRLGIWFNKVPVTHEVLIRQAGDPLATDQGRAVALSRRGQGSRVQGRHEQHAPQPHHAEHPAVRGELVAHRHHAGDRRHHALRDVAAHAPARQEPALGDRLSRTAASRRSSTCRSSTSTGSSTTS